MQTVQHTQIGFFLLVCLLSVAFAGVVYFNCLARGASRSLRQVWVPPVCWVVIVTVYAVARLAPASAEAMRSLVFVPAFLGLANGLKTNLEKEPRDQGKIDSVISSQSTT